MMPTKTGHPTEEPVPEEHRKQPSHLQITEGRPEQKAIPLLHVSRRADPATAHRQAGAAVAQEAAAAAAAVEPDLEGPEEANN